MMNLRAEVDQPVIEASLLCKGCMRRRVVRGNLIIMTKLDWFSVLKPKHPKARRKYDIRSSDLKLQQLVLINLFNRTKCRLTAQSGNEPFAHDGIPYVGLAQVIRNSSKNGRMRLEVVITSFGSDMPNSAIPGSKCTPTFPQVATGYINCTNSMSHERNRTHRNRNVEHQDQI